MADNNPQSVTPFYLPELHPDRTSPRVGDLLTTPDRGRCAGYVWLGPHEDPALHTAYWVSGPRAGTTEPLHDDTLTVALAESQYCLLAAEVPSLNQAMWIVENDSSSPTMRPAAYELEDDPGTPPATTSIDVTALSFQREYSLTPVQAFLDHPVVDHARGGTSMHVASFTARYRGDIVAAATLENPNSAYRDNGTTIQLSRYAAHPNRPENTASWFLSRVARWAALAGYSRVLTYAGQSYNNTGTIYQALGLTLEKPPEHANGRGYTNRGPGRDTWADYEKWTYIGLQTVGDTHPTRARSLTDVPSVREDLPQNTTTLLTRGTIQFPEPDSAAPKAPGTAITFEDVDAMTQATLPNTTATGPHLTEQRELKGAYTHTPLDAPDSSVPSSQWRWTVADATPAYVHAVFKEHGTESHLPDEYRAPATESDRLSRPFAVVVQSAVDRAPLAAAVVERPRNAGAGGLQVLAFSIHPDAEHPRNLGGWLLSRLTEWVSLSSATGLGTQRVPITIRNQVEAPASQATHNERHVPV